MENKPNIQLVVGLGNPGPQYDKTRHNAGFWLIKALGKKYGAHLKIEAKFKGFFGEAVVVGCKCKLLMPTTFMNLSGESVRQAVSFYRIPVESILVVHDELDFSPGTVRLKNGGGANSHNGVQNIIDNLGSNGFWRLRIGIGKPLLKENMENYVTTPPSSQEQQQIYQAIDKAIEVFPELVSGCFVKAMQELHCENKKN